MFRFVQPFRQGQYRAQRQVVVGGTPADAYPFGARYPDGSHRYARVYAPVHFEAKGHQDLAVELDHATKPAFQVSEELAAGLAGWLVGVQIGAQVQLFGGWEMIEAGSHMAAFRSRMRVPGYPMWFELRVELFSHQSYANWYFRCGDSDMSDPAVVHDIPHIALVAKNCHVAVRDAAGVVMHRKIDGDVTRTYFDMGSRWSDGESLARRGAFVFLDEDASQVHAEAQSELMAISSYWEVSGAYGAFGLLPGKPGGLDLADRTKRDYAAHANGAWAAPVLGLGTFPGATGKQGDFAAHTQAAEAQELDPRRSQAVLRSAYQEACRPTHLRNPDGSPFEFHNAGRLVMWNDQIHWTSPDLLGKATAPPPGAHGFNGIDRQHDSCFYLATAATLYGDPFCLDEMEHKASLRHQTMRTDSGNPVVDNMDASRGEGRMLQTAVWCWLVTGMDSLTQVIRDRVQMNVRQWNGSRSSVQRPLKVIGPDPRWLDGKTSMWLPWWETLAVPGFAMVAEHLGMKEARDLAYAIGRSAFLYGSKRLPTGGFGIYGAVEWTGGGDTGRKQWPSNNGQDVPGMFNFWGKIAAEWLQAEATKVEDGTLLDYLLDFNQFLEPASQTSWENWEWSGSAY